MTIAQALLILYVFLGIAGVLIVLIIVRKHHHLGEGKRQFAARELFYKRYYDGIDIKLPRHMSERSKRLRRIKRCGANCIGNRWPPSVSPLSKHWARN